jgi:hypothetical protein
MTQYPKGTNRSTLPIYLEGILSAANVDSAYAAGWRDRYHTEFASIPLLDRVSAYGSKCVVQFVDADFSGTSFSSTGTAKAALLSHSAVNHAEVYVSSTASARYTTVDNATSKAVYHRGSTNPDNVSWSREWLWHRDPSYTLNAPSRHLWNPSHSELSDVIKWNREIGGQFNVVCQWAGNMPTENATQYLSMPPAMHLLYQINDALAANATSVSIHSLQRVQGGTLVSDTNAWQNLINMVGTFRSRVLPLTDPFGLIYIKPVSVPTGSDPLPGIAVYDFGYGDISKTAWDAFVAGGTFTTTANGRRQSTSNTAGLALLVPSHGNLYVPNGHDAPAFTSDGKIRCYSPSPRVAKKSTVGVNNSAFISSLHLTDDTVYHTEFEIDLLSTSRWDLVNPCILWQLSLASGQPAALAVEIASGKWQLTVRHSSLTTAEVSVSGWQNTIRRNSTLFQAGTHKVRLSFRRDHRTQINGGIGYATLSVDGSVIEQYDGPIGCNDTSNRAGIPYLGVDHEDTVGATTSPNNPEITVIDWKLNRVASATTPILPTIVGPVLVKTNEPLRVGMYPSGAEESDGSVTLWYMEDNTSNVWRLMYATSPTGEGNFTKRGVVNGLPSNPQCASVQRLSTGSYTSIIWSGTSPNGYRTGTMPAGQPNNMTVTSYVNNMVDVCSHYDNLYIHKNHIYLTSPNKTLRRVWFNGSSQLTGIDYQNNTYATYRSEMYNMSIWKTGNTWVGFQGLFHINDIAFDDTFHYGPIIIRLMRSSDGINWTAPYGATPLIEVPGGMALGGGPPFVKGNELWLYYWKTNFLHNRYGATPNPTTEVWLAKWALSDVIAMANS